MTPSFCRFTNAPLIRLPACIVYSPDARNWSYDHDRAMFPHMHCPRFARMPNSIRDSHQAIAISD